ncbi:hypothetical protein AB0A98_22555 [Streptomyces chrestomyceticus]|uniref:hypothetical protein n=1 Tax=Streptomyces chrestomyceticus TaxID=68185 RepID=UPI00341047BA
MTSLFERLDEEEAIARGELSALRDKVAQTEERLARLAITRDTLAGLVGFEANADRNEARASGPTDGEEGAAGAGAPKADGPKGAAEGQELEELPLAVAQERALALLAQAGRAVNLKDIVPAIGEKRMETTRSRLKAMVKRGLLAEEPTAWFRIATADAEKEEAAAS